MSQAVTTVPEPNTAETGAPPAAGRRLPPWLRDALIMAALFASVLAVSSPMLITHLQAASDHWRVNDDARSFIPPFLKYRYPGTFPNDYPAQYFLDSLPIGYKALFTLASYVKDPRWVSKVLPYPLLLLLVLTIGIAAKRLGGWVAAWLSMALVLSSQLYIERMTGGIPRTFAFPLVAAAGLALAFGRTYWLCAVVLLGAAFYPVIGLICGLVLTALLLLVPAKDRGDASSWSLRKRLLVLTGTAMLSGLVLLPPMLQTRQYGALLGPRHEAQYPELGPGGRFGNRDRPPFNLRENLHNAAVRALTGPRRISGFFNGTNEKKFWRWRVYTSFALAGIGAIALAWRDSAGRRLLALGVAAIVGHTIARNVLPYFYLPERYTLFVIPVYILLALPAGLIVLWRAVLPARWWGRIVGAVLLVCIFGTILYCMGIGRPTKAGLSHWINGKRTVIRYIKSLPPDAMIAGWPRGVMEDVPYETKRQAFITYELHPTFHRTFTDVMRARTNALLAAYFATDVAPLLRLRDEFGVTHLFVERVYYENPPHYYRPFDDMIPSLMAGIRERGAEVDRQGAAAIFDNGEHVLLELSKLQATPQTVPSPAPGDL